MADEDDQRARVLIVDDEADIRTIASLSLDAVGGWEVIEASSGQEALRVLDQKTIDLLLLDMMLPEMDGRQILKAIRQRPECKDIPAIFMTANSRRSELEQLLREGAAGIIRKPFDPMSLPKEIDRILGR